VHFLEKSAAKSGKKHFLEKSAAKRRTYHNNKN